MLRSILGAAPTFGGPGADNAALYIGKAAEHGQHQAPGAGTGVGPWFRRWAEFHPGVHDAIDDAKDGESAAREPVNSVGVAGGKPVGRANVNKAAQSSLDVFSFHSLRLPDYEFVKPGLDRSDNLLIQRANERV